MDCKRGSVWEDKFDRDMQSKQQYVRHVKHAKHVEHAKHAKCSRRAFMSSLAQMHEYLEYLGVHVSEGACTHWQDFVRAMHAEYNEPDQRMAEACEEAIHDNLRLKVRPTLERVAQATYGTTVYQCTCGCGVRVQRNTCSVCSDRFPWCRCP